MFVVRVTDQSLDRQHDMFTVGASEAGRSTPLMLRWGDVAGDGFGVIANGLQVNTTMFFVSNIIIVALVIGEVNDGKGFRLEVAASVLNVQCTICHGTCVLFGTILCISSALFASIVVLW